MNRPAVIFPPQAHLDFQRGFNLLGDLLACTLGPSQGVIYSSTELKPQPEVLTDSATISRRITGLSNPVEETGLMLLRGLVWRMNERVGDGGATTAVLAQTMLRAALRSLLAGANSEEVSQGILQAAHQAANFLSSISQPASGETDLAAVARAACGHEKLSLILGEMFDLLGPLAHIVVEDYAAPYLERVYLDGGRWAGSLASPVLMSDPARHRAILPNCRVALYDGVLSRGEEVIPLLELVQTLDPPHLLLIAHKITGEATTILAANHSSGRVKIVATSLTRAGEKAATDLADLAVLCGGQVISPVMGRKLENIRVEDLGAARRVEGNELELLVSGGQGEQAAIRHQVEMLHNRVKNLPPGDKNQTELELRLGRLSGSAGILKIGAYSPVERADTHQRAVQAVKVLHSAMEEGVLPGGGSAYLHARQAIKPLCLLNRGGQAYGARAVAESLAAPFSTILSNGNVDSPGLWMDAVLQEPPGLLFDVITGRLVSDRESGILDATRVARAALETAASGVAMALHTGAIVLKRKPQISYEP